MGSKPNKTPLIVIVGETASGKSALAMSLAERFGGEVIAADSWTVYRGFDIGTAKPTREEQTRVPHYLLDVANPRVGFSAAAYKRLATSVIEDIQKREKIPVLVGGTGLYIDSILFDYQFLPPGPADQRTFLNSLPIPALLKMIEQREIDTAGIDIRNKRRLIRLLETDGQRPVKHELRENTLIFGLSSSKEILKVKVIRRVDYMFEAGLEAEVAALVEEYGWNVEPMKGIGYREFREYFEGSQTLAETRDRIINATMDLAKKQRTWFKRNKSIHWLEKQSEVVDLVTTILNK